MFLNNLFSKIFRNQNRIEYTTGKAVPLEEIYLSELEKYPIWIYALEEEDVEGQDEFWVKPITNSTNVEAELSTPYILLKIKENNCPVSALLDIKNMKLDDLQYWDYKYGNWEELNKLDMPSPIHLISIPSILGKPAVEFSVDIKPKNQTTAIARTLMGPDECKDMYKTLPPNICPVCHTPLKREINPNFIVSNKRSCLRYTYDSFCIVTEDFKNFCTLNHYPNLEFKEFPKSPGNYYFTPLDIFPLDPIRQKIKFEECCSSCGGFKGAYGSSPGFKSKNFTLPSNDFIYRSDIEFGSEEKKSPLIIVGLETEIKMKKFGLKGIYFDDVYE